MKPAGLFLFFALPTYIFAQAAGDQYPFARGKISQLDPVAKQIFIKTSFGDRVFATTNTTYLIAGDSVITFDKLKIGDSVKLNYFTNQTGQAIIRRMKTSP